MERGTVYEWLFTPDAADISRNKGCNIGVTSGKVFDTETKAIWHGKQWLKTTGRTGTITAVPAESRKPVCIFDC